MASKTAQDAERRQDAELFALYKKTRAIESELSIMRDSRYKIQRLDGSTTYLSPAESIFSAGSIKAVQIGTEAIDLCNVLLFFAIVFGHPSPEKIKFYNCFGDDISGETHRNFVDWKLTIDKTREDESHE